MDFFTGFSILNLIFLSLTLAALKTALTSGLSETIIYSGAFSLFSSLAYLLMDAPDVAMTEAALGVCLPTCVFLRIIKIVSPKGKNLESLNRKPWLCALLCLALGSVLVAAAPDLSEYGDPEAPLFSGVNKYYVSFTKSEIGVNSIVAAILASYRGYDTLGETTVILIAGIGVALIFGARKNG